MADIAKLYRGIKAGKLDYNKLNQKGKDDLFKYRYSIGDIDTSKPLNERAKSLIQEFEPEPVKEKPKKAGFLEQTGYALGGIPEGAKQFYRGTEKAATSLIGSTAQLFEREEQRQRTIAPEIFEGKGPSLAELTRKGAELQLKKMSEQDLKDAQKRFEYEQEKGISGIAKHGRTITQLGTQMAPALITGTPVALAPQIIGESAAEGVERGLSIGEATGQAIPRATFEVALEKIPVEKVGKLFKVGGKIATEAGEEAIERGIKGFVKRTSGAALSEMAEEAISSIANSAMDHYVYGDEFDIKKVLSDAGVEALTAAEMVTLMSALATGVNVRRMGRLRKQMNAQTQQEIRALNNLENTINTVKSEIQKGNISPKVVLDIINSNIIEKKPVKRTTKQGVEIELNKSVLEQKILQRRLADKDVKKMSKVEKTK